MLKDIVRTEVQQKCGDYALIAVTAGGANWEVCRCDRTWIYFMQRVLDMAVAMKKVMG